MKVHERVQRILNNPHSHPNSIHSDLLRLFESPAKVRLVTTNFDHHFSAAADELFKKKGACEEHYAPALPLGHCFAGIVYLHGSVDKPAQRLVLSDADFGRAYLTEGWARIFLQRVFESFTVLFVGYSHRDPVMNYIARGFTPEMGKSKRFALVPVGDEELWRYRGIHPVPYPMEAGPNPHAPLPKALAAWAQLSRLGILDKERKIAALAALPSPPLDPRTAILLKTRYPKCLPRVSLFVMLDLHRG